MTRFHRFQSAFYNPFSAREMLLKALILLSLLVFFVPYLAAAHPHPPQVRVLAGGVYVEPSDQFFLVKDDRKVHHQTRIWRGGAAPELLGGPDAELFGGIGAPRMAYQQNAFTMEELRRNGPVATNRPRYRPQILKPQQNSRDN